MKPVSAGPTILTQTTTKRRYLAKVLAHHKKLDMEAFFGSFYLWRYATETITISTSRALCSFCFYHSAVTVTGAVYAGSPCALCTFVRP